MKIEKLNENKIKITFNCSDLEENHIDFHSFMSNSIESQALFLKILDKAEEEFNFQTDHYKLEINTLALSDGNFILTVTRMQKDSHINKNITVHTKRKKENISSTFSIYRFINFDDFFHFCNFLFQDKNKNLLLNLENQNFLYKSEENYFLVINTSCIELFQKEYLFSCITEFATFVTNSSVFYSKLQEVSCLIGKNAIHECMNI